MKREARPPTRIYDREHIGDREFQIAFLLACGHLQSEIAKRLGISLDTVKNHIYNACYVLGLSGRNQLVAWCIRATGMYN